MSIKEKNKTVFWANQFDNTSNLNAHFNTTGPEIWEQTCGKVDGFICAIGSGGTIAGVKVFKEKTKNTNWIIRSLWISTL